MFLLLEILSVLIIFQYSHFQHSRFLNFSANIEGYIYNKIGGLKEYLNLKKTNQELALENNLLLNQIDYYSQVLSNMSATLPDSLPGRKYSFIPAKVVNNSVNKQYNFITIDKGRKHGIEPEMGVISSSGVVGVVYAVSGNFSRVIPILNLDFRLSAKIRKNDYYGSLIWTGTNNKTAILSEIPYHVDIQVGDTIVTSGYSAIFPEGILVGKISRFNTEEGNFYKIWVEISVDFKNLVQVNVVRNLLLDEQMMLENGMLND